MRGSLSLLSVYVWPLPSRTSSPVCSRRSLSLLLGSCLPGLPLYPEDGEVGAVRTRVSFFRITRRHVPEITSIYSHICENMKSNGMSLIESFVTSAINSNTKNLHIPQRVCLCVSCNSQNEQRLFR
jgi:hypothetical protein